jgi:hypothetical protein
LANAASARRQVKLGTTDCIVEAGHTARVGAGDDDKIRILPCGDGRPNFGGHLFCADQVFPGKVSAAFQSCGRGNPSRLVNKLARRQQTYVGNAGRSRQGSTGKIDRLKAERLGHPTHEWIEDTRNLQRTGRPGLS